MKTEKIEFLKRYYCFDPNIPDSEIVDKLGDSLGSFVFEIKKAKHDLAKSIVNAFPKIKMNHKPTWQDQPTKDGYYWFMDDCNDLKIVEVYWADNKILGAQVAFCGSDNDEDLMNITGKWYGPITPPEGEL